MKIKNSRIKIIIQIIIKKIVMILIILLALYNFIYVIFNMFNPNANEAISIFELKAYVIKEKSMENQLKRNDLVITKKVKDFNLAVNDIISFYDSDSVRIHRITNIEKQYGNIYYTTKGDKNYNPDANKITIDKINGKVVKKIPKLRNFSKYITI